METICCFKLSCLFLNNHFIWLLLVNPFHKIKNPNTPDFIFKEDSMIFVQIAMCFHYQSSIQLKNTLNCVTLFYCL